MGQLSHRFQYVYGCLICSLDDLFCLGYLLSKKEQRSGSPEKPLSALGALGYKNYWTLALMRYLKTAPSRPTLEG